MDGELGNWSEGERDACLTKQQGMTAAAAAAAAAAVVPCMQPSTHTVTGQDD
jgi:hypothetical protein